MSMIHSLKEYLSISESATYLQEKLNQKVEAKDILEMTLDNKLDLLIHATEYFDSFQICSLNIWTNDTVNLFLSDISQYQSATPTPPELYLFPVIGSNRSTIFELLNEQATDALTKSLRPTPIFILSQDRKTLFVVAQRLSSGKKVPSSHLPDYGRFKVKKANLDKLINSKPPILPPFIKNLSDSSEQAPPMQNENQLAGNEESLLKTIGALAKLAAHLGGNDVGTFDKPNAIALWAKLAEIEGESLPYGLGKSTMTGRISKGCNIYKKGKN